MKYRALGFLLSPLSAFAWGAALPHFISPNAIWNVDVTNATLRPNSTQMMDHLEFLATLHTGPGLWGGDKKASNSDFQIDFSFYALHATNSTPTKPIVAFPDLGDYYTPDCENPGFLFPVPPGGGIEGTGRPDGDNPAPSYTCDTGDDCHLLVSNDTTQILYESFATDHVDASGVHATCGLSWNLARVYPRYGRGEHCTSADGAGFPIAPLLFNADEVWTAAQASGDLGHAIRFILGNTPHQSNTHVHPSSHGTSATSDTDVNSVPYGSRLRLNASFDITTLKGVPTNPAVRAILRTLKKYGMFLSDGGTIPLTAESDYYTQHKWSDADVDIDSHSLFGVNPSNFEVVEAGDPLSNDGPPNNGDCTLTPADFIFIDGYDF